MKKSVLVVCSAIFAAGVIALWSAMQVLPVYEYETVRVNIPSGCNKSEVDSILVGALGKSFGGKVARTLRIAGYNPAQAHGSYLVEPGMRVFRVAQNIRKRRQTPVRFTFNNLRTLQQLADRAAEVMEFSADDFISACDSVLAPKGYRSAAEYPAAFLPDTYEFYWTDTACKFVRKLSEFRDGFWTEKRRAQAAALGMRPVEVAIIASIVEEESAVSDERPLIARLYMNRLHKGMKLQADPTVKFAVGDFSLRRITNRHLAVESPYNTYRHIGLPPGPIRIADAATLQAVLTAPEHDYMYMCAKEDFSGRHNFAQDGKTHMANARRYRAALDRRGIK